MEMEMALVGYIKEKPGNVFPGFYNIGETYFI